jgi:hypothetical protein
MKKELISFFLTDFWRKIGALAIALIVWTGIHADLQRNRTIENQPVTIKFDDQDRGVVLAPPPHVAIVLRGSERRLNDLNLAGIVIKAKIPPNYSKSITGHTRYAVDLTTANVILPSDSRGISCQNIIPSQIDVEIDRLETLSAVPVRAQVPSDAAGIASQLTITPATIEVTGPSSQLRNLTAIPTNLLDPRLLDDGKKVEISLEEKPLLRYRPAQVQVILKNHSKTTPPAP